MAELAGGVPLAIVEWLRARQEGVRDSTMSTRLGHLSPDARALLEVLAVAGGDTPGALLAATSPVGDLAVTTAGLAAAGWLKRESASGLELSFPPDGAAAHLRRAHQSSGAPSSCTAGWRSCWRWRRAEATRWWSAITPIRAAAPRRVELIERGGDVTRDRFDDDSAARWYRAALDRGRDALAAGEGDEARQIRIALKLGIVLRYRGDVIQSEHVLKDALELATHRNDRWAQVQARRALARLATAWNQHEGAKEHLTAAVQAALGGSDSSTVAELYLELSECMVKLGDLVGAERELWEGMVLCTGGDGPEGEGGPEPVWRMLVALGELALRQGRSEDAVITGQHALRHAERTGVPLAGQGRAPFSPGPTRPRASCPRRASNAAWPPTRCAAPAIAAPPPSC